MTSPLELLQTIIDVIFNIDINHGCPIRLGVEALLETFIAIGVTLAVFFLFLLVFYQKERREKATGRRSGCQHHHSPGGCGHCQDRQAEDPSTVAILPRKE